MLDVRSAATGCPEAAMVVGVHLDPRTRHPGRDVVISAGVLAEAVREEEAGPRFPGGWPPHRPKRDAVAGGLDTVHPFCRHGLAASIARRRAASARVASRLGKAKRTFERPSCGRE